jgi:hypothetical protein
MNNVLFRVQSRISLLLAYKCSKMLYLTYIIKIRNEILKTFFYFFRKLADIAPLLDVEDMVRMQKPDWKCVFTYVQSFYRKLNSHERNKAVA